MRGYNTTLSNIKLPEYGRNIQSLIDYCKTIPDRDKRTRYAYGIVTFMSRVVSIDKPTEDQQKILWDHLALLSNFELDIDYPYEILKKESLDAKPEPLSPSAPKIRYRMYGKIVESLIEKALEIEEEDKRLRLLELCANHMKLQFHLINTTADEDDNKIIHDLVDYVGPKYADECYKVYLYSLEELKENEQYSGSNVTPAPAKKKKKKKKKKAAAAK